MTPIRWRKSTRSGTGSGGCVEVAHDLSTIRDSKNPTGPTLTVNVPALLARLREPHA